LSSHNNTWSGCGKMGSFVRNSVAASLSLTNLARKAPERDCLLEMPGRPSDVSRARLSLIVLSCSEVLAVPFSGQELPDSAYCVSGLAIKASRRRGGTSKRRCNVFGVSGEADETTERRGGSGAQDCSSHSGSRHARIA
jgi:hypothetical protein